MKHYLLTSILVFLLAGCQTATQVSKVTPIAGYAFLNSPIGEGKYLVGSKWAGNHGTTGQPLAEVHSSPGLESIIASEHINANVSLEGMFKKWIVGQLDIKESEVAQIKFKNLTHHYISDFSNIHEKCKVLSEIITADSIEAEFANKTEIGNSLNLKMSEFNISDADSHVKAAFESENRLIIRSNKRLIVALKVIEVKCSANHKTAVVKLHNDYIGKEQTLPFNYSIKTNKANFLERSLSAAIVNKQFPSFTAKNFTLKSDSEIDLFKHQVDNQSDTYSINYDKLRVSHNKESHQEWIFEISRHNIQYKPTDKIGL